MTRGVSTVVDASVAVLLVSAAAVALVTIPADSPRPPDADATARSVLASTATATYGPEDTRRVSGRVSTLLAHAAVAADRGESAGFVRAVEQAAERVLVDVSTRVELVAAVGDTRLRIGSRPPAAASVAATTHHVAAGDQTVAVSVRTWSP